jgi:hypothetical protein
VLVAGDVFARPCSEAEACAVAPTPREGVWVVARGGPAWQGFPLPWRVYSALLCNFVGEGRSLRCAAPRLFHAARRRLSGPLGIPKGIWVEVSFRPS